MSFSFESLRYSMGTGGGKAVSDPGAPPLPASAIEYWRGDKGASAANAIGQILGYTLPGVGGPTVVTDGANFNGRTIYRATAAGAGWFLQQGVTIGGGAFFPYVYIVARWRTVPAALQDLGGLGRFADRITIGIGGNASGQHFGRTAGVVNGAHDISGPAINTSVHRLECWWDAAGLLSLRVDGALTTGSFVADTTVVNDCIGIGFNPGFPVQSPDASIAFMLLCSTVPSAGEIAALNTYAQTYWGAP